jgi:thiosulfate dehydrogenase [quinone] large subunit
MTAIVNRPPQQVTVPGTVQVGQPRQQPATGYIWAALRLALGWVFMWAFLDKAFGLGFSTASENAWVNGGSPTEGFLTFGTSGPLAGAYQNIAGAAWADVLFMAGLAGLGVALLAGIGLRVAAVSGSLLMLMMWSAALPPETNPFLTYHLIYAVMLIGFAVVAAGDTLGLGKVWARTSLVQRLPWLK